MQYRALRLLRSSTVTFAAVFAALACGEPPPPSFTVTPRAPGVRAPVTSECSLLDDTRCLLPWPSSEFLVADPSTETGVRVSVSVDSINARDTAGPWLTGDGFSRLTSVVAGFPVLLDPASVGGPLGGALRLFVATPGHARYAEEEPLRLEITPDSEFMSTTSALTGDPLTMLEPGTDYVVVVTDDLRAVDGATIEPSRGTLVALGLATPASAAEAAIAGYHAPTIDFLGDVGIDPARVLRVWDFTTRTEHDADGPLMSMRDASLAALESGEVTVVIDRVTHRASGDIHSIVEGHFEGMPGFIDADFELSRGPDGLPVVMGATDARFRVLIPRGTGDYRTVLFGHGAGGTVNDGSFDETLAAEGIAKVNVEFRGWTDAEIISTLTTVADRVLVGASQALAPLMQSVAHSIAIERSIAGILGDALSAPMLGGEVNPHAGRRPGLDGPIWVGGSLGGTMGLVITALDDNLHFGVLNVPGAAWSHFARNSELFNLFIAGIRRRNGGDVNIAVLIAMSQSMFDMVDGATFSEAAIEAGDVFLAQESMGDQVLPNAGNEFVGIVTHATMIGTPISPIHGLPTAMEVVGSSGITQFDVGVDGVFDVHGFAANQDTVPGRAAFEQIRLFLTTAWDDGTPTIRVPSLCPAGSCDFRVPGP